MSYFLTQKDKRLLHELDFDARQPIAHIAKKIGLSKEVVNYRMKRLEQESIVTGYYPVLDIAKLGFAFFRVLLRFQNLSPEKEEELIKGLQDHPAIAWLATLEGEWDMVLVIWAKDIYAFKEESDNILREVAGFVKKKYVTIATKIHHFKKNYLYATKDYDDFVFGNHENRITIDATDYKILLALLKNARTPLVDIANNLGVTANAVSYRLKNMERSGLILGYRAFVDIKKLGYQHFKVLLYTENLTELNKQKLIEYLRMYPHAVYVTEAIAEADLEFEVHLERNTDLYRFMKRMRSEFSEIIRNYDIVLTYEEHRINYLPEL